MARHLTQRPRVSLLVGDRDLFYSKHICAEAHRTIRSAKATSLLSRLPSRNQRLEDRFRAGFAPDVAVIRLLVFCGFCWFVPRHGLYFASKWCRLSIGPASQTEPL